MSLASDQALDLLLKVSEKCPAFILDSIDLGQHQRSPDDTSSTSFPDWCICLHCQEMLTDTDKLCCMKTPQSCLSLLPVSMHEHNKRCNACIRYEL